MTRDEQIEVVTNLIVTNDWYYGEYDNDTDTTDYQPMNRTEARPVAAKIVDRVLGSVTVFGPAWRNRVDL